MGHPGFCGCSEKSKICGCLENPLVSFWELDLSFVYRAKAKGRSLFRDFAPAFRFRRSGSVPRSQLLVTSDLFETCERSPLFPVLFRHHIRCTSFLVPSVSSQFPGCCASVVRSPCVDRCPSSSESRFRSSSDSCFRSSSDLRCRFSSEFRLRFSAGLPSAFSLAGRASSSPGVPSPDLLRAPLPVLLMALVYSLLLEDCSSVDFEDTPDLPERNGG